MTISLRNSRENTLRAMVLYSLFQISMIYRLMLLYGHNKRVNKSIILMTLAIGTSPRL